MKHRLATTVDGLSVLPDHSAICTVTWNRYRLGEIATSAVSGRIAHRSRFIVCQQTGDLILWSETAVSDFSDRMVRDDLLTASDKPPHRRGLADEFGRCSATDNRLLLDELAKSEFSGRVADRDLLRPSAKSRRLALPSELVKCEASGIDLLPDETGLCHSSGKRVDRSLLAECELTHKTILESLLAKSDFSGMVVDPKLLVRSDKPPHRRGVAGEFGRCSATDNRLLLDELAKSEFSGRVADRDLLRPSAKSGRLALPSEMVTCDVTRIEVLPDETGVCSKTAVRVVLSELGRCAVSHKPMLKSLLDSSDVSGNIVDRELLLRSESLPHRRGLADEFGRCAVTGRRLLKDELGESAVSKRVVGLDRLVRSEASRDFALPEEMEACPRTGKRVLPAELETCCITHARVLRTELERSDLSGHRALRDHGVRLSDSRWALADETVKCVWLDEQIPKSEAGRCALTGQTFSKKLLNDLGQLASLADLLDGISGHRHPDPNLASRLRQVDPDLAGLTAVDMIRSPGRVRAICGEVHTKGWFRTKVRYVGLLIRSTPKAISVIGHGVMGYRDERGEFVIEEKDLVFGEA